MPEGNLRTIPEDDHLWVQGLRACGLWVAPDPWSDQERGVLTRAVERMAEAFGGPEKMRRALGGVLLIKQRCGDGGALAFWPRPPWMSVRIGEALLHQQPEWLGEVAVVHELAHIWDARTAGLVRRILGRPGRIVREMVRFVGDEPGPTRYGSGIRSVVRVPCPACEEWAESVAAYLYPEYIAHLALRPEEQGWPARAGRPHHLRPALGPRHRAYVERCFAKVRGV